MSEHHRLSDGKMAVAKSVVWQIDVGPMRVRCRTIKDSPIFVVETSMERGTWKRLTDTQLPFLFLGKFVATDQAKTAIAIATERARK